MDQPFDIRSLNKINLMTVCPNLISTKWWFLIEDNDG